MEILQVEYTNVFKRNIRSKAKYLLNVGGARSSKSYSIAQILVLLKLFKENNKQILVTRKTFPALKLTAYQLIVDLLEKYKIYNRVEHNKSDHIITNPYTKSRMVFLSVDNPERVKSTEWNYEWLEEANEFSWDDWVIFFTRLSGPTTPDQPNQIFLSFNPSDEQGWINQKLMLTNIFAEKMEVIQSSYKDNPFLDEDYKQLLESLKDQDINAYNIYAQGLWGVLTNIIYNPYQIINEFPESFDETIYGLDFGYNNPCALLEVNIKDQSNIYLKELLYQSKLTNADLIEHLKILISEKNRFKPIYADCAEPNRIEEISRAGFNIHPSDKDVETGINYCKRFKYFTLPECINLNKERAGYKWKTDRNGNVLEEPLKFNDHCMDTKRYALFSHRKNLPMMELYQ